METILIQLKHAKARKLLEELEDMEIIKLLGQPSQKNSAIKSSQLRGSLSKETTDALLKHITESRMEWKDRFPDK